MGQVGPPFAENSLRLVSQPLVDLRVCGDDPPRMVQEMYGFGGELEHGAEARFAGPEALLGLLAFRDVPGDSEDQVSVPDEDGVRSYLYRDQPARFLREKEFIGTGAVPPLALLVQADGLGDLVEGEQLRLDEVPADELPHSGTRYLLGREVAVHEGARQFHDVVGVRGVLVERSKPICREVALGIRVE